MNYFKILTLNEIIGICVYKVFTCINKYLPNFNNTGHKILVAKSIKNAGFKIHTGWKYTEIEFLINNCESNVKLRKGESSDIYVFEQIIVKEEYKRGLDLLRDNRINIQYIVDLGANIGLSSIYLSRYFSGSTLICVEPAPHNFKMLKRNLEGNNINSKNINKAIWYKDEILEISNNFRDGKDWSLTTIPVDSMGKDFKQVATITLDQLIYQNKIEIIDLLKIDIEGAERYLFLDYDKIDFILSRTKSLIIEIHDEFNIRDKINEVLYRNDFKLDNSGEYTVGINKSFLK